MSVTLRQLQYFQALAEHRHFGRAAEAVHISQPALSVQIRELEATLGGALVERQAREVRLTPFGRRVLDQAMRVLNEVRALEETARWKGGLSGRLALGVIPTIAPYLLPGALAALRARDIHLDVQVQEAKTVRLLEALKSGQLDAAVMALPVIEDGLVAEPLFEDRFLLAGTQAQLAALGSAETLRPTALRPAQLLLLEDGHCLTDQALEVCGQGRGHAQINMGASSLATLTRLVAAGFGLTLMPEMAALAERQAAPGMHLMRFTAPEPFRTIGLVRRASSVDDGWFSDLAEVLRRTGSQLIQTARADQPQ
ncbi:LysR family transcriptional regulator [Thalassobius vesicularis]|uniref:LysR family transcriptional regulator n=1 Tax=Thalassobius vesicularis TaxID=1294297 RepID=A0A4S3MC88_9RHOB|nr:LysR substrate-binding domain-containing protein [Thalassobius vesicularis]THD74985.1 LysR family transcriptional regulator [Thalassobius vesicularis]